MRSRIGRGAGRDTDQQAFGTGKFAGSADGVVIRHRDDLVYRRRIVCFRNESCADTLDFVRTRFTPRKDGRIGRFDGNDPDFRVSLFEPCTDPADGTAGTDAGYENIDFPVGVAPYLFGGRAFVYGLIGRIFELLQDDRSRMLVA